MLIQASNRERFSCGRWVKSRIRLLKRQLVMRVPKELNIPADTSKISRIVGEILSCSYPGKC